MHEQRAIAQQSRKRQVELLGGEPQHAQHALAGVGRNRRRLEDTDGAGVVAQNHVGECPADIDANAPGRNKRGGGIGHCADPTLAVSDALCEAPSS